jgi:predicted permease
MIPAAARLRSLWYNIVRRRDVDRALDGELSAYVALLADEYERAGMSPGVARRAALIDTGGVEQVKDATRDAWAGASIMAAARELRFAARSLRRAPAFLTVAVATLAIGIGGSTAVYTVIKGSLLRPLPGVEDPDRLVTIETDEDHRRVAEISYPDYRDLQRAAPSLAGLAGFNGTSLAVSDSTGSTSEWVSLVTDDFFATLGVRAALGRTFGVGSDGRATDTPAVAVLGYGLWQRRFGGSPRIIGARVRIQDVPFTIIGVAPAGFIGGMASHPMEVFVPFVLGGQASPLVHDIDVSSRHQPWLRVVARLADGKTVADAQRDVDMIAGQLASAYPATNAARTLIVLARSGMTAEERREASRVPRLLAVAVALLLLIACGNVANLFLVRATARRRELATRVALGASQGALIRQVALEGALVAALAGCLGVLVAVLLVHSATLVNTVVSIETADLSIDLRVVLIALAASALTAVLVSAVPALQVLRLSPGAVLKDGGAVIRGSSSGRRLLIVAQVSGSLVMLSAAAITFAAFHRVLDAHQAFDPGGLTDGSLDVGKATPDTATQIALVRAVLARANADPRFAGAAVATTIPPFEWASSVLAFRGAEAPPVGSSAERRAATGTRVNAIQVSESFFDVMRIPIIAGRGLAATDTRATEPVVVVSRRLAGVLWPSRNAIGQEIAWPPVEGPGRPALRVVGVAEDTRDASLSDEPPLAMYLPFTQQPSSWFDLLIRSRTGAPMAASTIANLIASVDPHIAVRSGRTLRERLWDEVAPQRRASAWIGVFAAIALLLSAIGLYGVVEQNVLQRTRELAVRCALGATPGGILTFVLGAGARLLVVGVLLGGATSVAGVHALRRIFPSVDVSDPLPLLGAAVVLTIVLLAATFVPARRASRLNPAEVLRTD